ncbi:MAG: imelysin family protein [Oligoflexus sp.]
MKLREWAQLSAVFCLLSCSSSSDTPSDEAGQPLIDFDRQALLEQWLQNPVARDAQAFQLSSESLATQINLLCDQLSGASDFQGQFVSARKQWRETMENWQRIEAYQFGPLADLAGTRRFDIYTWPLVNSCAVDRQVALLANNPENFTISDNDSVKGLAAIEYLLFDDDAAHSCTEAVTETQGWNERVEAERYEYRCRYLQILSEDLNSQAVELQSAWEEATQVWLAEASDQDLQNRINQISDSLFYLDATVKDKKLGAPLGIHPSCRAETCPEQIEHSISGFSLSAIRANLQGFQSFYLGADPNEASDALGFDDYLTAAGAEELAQQMTEHLETAIASAEQLEEEDSLLNLVNRFTASECDPTSAEAVEGEQAVCDLYRQIKKITDELKSEFVQILQLSTPAQSSGDND